MSIQIPANAPGRTGRHIVYTIWQASHLDQSYYLCSDVDFGGSGPTTPPPTSTPPTSTPPTSTPPTSTPPTSPPPTTPNPAGGCTATYAITGSWGGGFQAEVKVTNGGSPIRGWSVSWNYQNGQQVSSAWNATVTSSGTLVTARNAAYNGTLAAGCEHLVRLHRLGRRDEPGAQHPVLYDDRLTPVFPVGALLDTRWGVKRGPFLYRRR